jgi:hypothetical protein
MVEFLKPDEILFVFRGSAVHRNQILAPWALNDRFDRYGIYVRTLNGLRRVDLKTIAGVRAALPDDFVLCDRGVIVNQPEIRRRRKLRRRNDAKWVKWIGFRVTVGEESRVEWVRLNPRRVRDVLGPFE